MDVLICAGLLAVCVPWDIAKNEIPPVALLCGAVAAVIRMPQNGAGYVLLGAMIPLLQLPLYGKGVMGAGDIKLQMILGSLMGPRFSWHLMLGSFLCGGVLAVGIWLRRCGSDRSHRNGKFAFAPAIALGFWAVCLNVR